jgi:DNA mismatch repair protein MutS
VTVTAASSPVPHYDVRAAALAELAALDPDTLTPREALDALYRLKQLGG